MIAATRRDFLKTSAGFVALAVAGTTFDFKKEKLKLSFSTLGCPDWPFEKIVSFAAANNYDGIEFRGIQRELDLTKTAAFSDDQKIQASLKLLKDKNLKVVDLGSSTTLHLPEGE